MTVLCAIHPSNKIEYEPDARVEIAFEGDATKIMTGKVIGIAIRNLVDFWIVALDTPIEGYPYSAISVQHTFLRPAGDNRPFLCEGVPRVIPDGV